MLDFKVHHVGVYRYAQETTWTNPFPVLGLHVSGLIYRQRSDSQHIERDPPPYLHIYGAGTESTYAYGSDRENWVIQLDSKDICNSEQGDSCEIKSDGQWISLPQRVLLNNKQRSQWQQHCQQLLEHSRDASPRGELLVKSNICSMLGAFIELSNKAQRKTPAEIFKQLIDEDEHFTKNLSELSEQCGYSADHMRILFTKHFALSPVQYRMRRRLSFATELITNTRLSINEISEQLGFQHSSHFCTAYKKHYGTSPGQDMKQLRL